MPARTPEQRRARLAAKRATAAAPANDFVVTVVTTPLQSDGLLSLESDLRLVKSAILYADRVRLLSYPAMIVGQFSAARQRGPTQTIQFLQQLDDRSIKILGLDPAMVRQIGVSQVAGRPAARRGTKADEAKKLHRQDRMLTEELSNGIEGVDLHSILRSINRSGGAEIESAINAGRLSFSWNGYDQFDQDDDTTAFFELLSDIVYDPGTRLVFDPALSARVRQAMTANGRNITNLVERHAREALTATGFVDRLEVFPEAKMVDILRAKEELAEPLQRYRAAATTFAAKLTATAFEPETKNEIDDLYHNEVKQRLKVLQRELSRTRLFVDSAKKLPQSLPHGATSGFLTNVYMDFGTQGAILSGLGSLLTVAGATAGIERQERKKLVSNDSLFYLLELPRYLKPRRPSRGRL